MTDILVVAEIAAGVLKKASLSAIKFGQEASKASGGTFSILAIGDGAASAAAHLTGFGAKGVVTADDAFLAGYTAEKYAATVAAAAAGFGVVAMAASQQGKDLAPRVAGKLGAGYAPDISAFKAEGSKLIYKRAVYAGNALAWLSVETAAAVVSVRPTEFAPAEPTGGASPVSSIAVDKSDPAAARVEFISFDVVKSERPELTEAKVIVSGGRSIKEKFMEVLTPLADTLGAAIGASRAACDANYCAPELQVGQTGKMVAPQLYIAIGISGAIQHLAGMKGSKNIVAINKDAEAPIFQVADYGLVADLFVAVPELNAAVKAAKG